tara:strand:+ start:88 stop:489 length:402 start_codon:yes stop_codon:yes gene_type:complete
VIKKIEHIGIAVESIEKSLPIFEALLNEKSFKTEVVDSEYVKTAFIQIGESKIELLEPTHKDSEIAKFLLKNKSGFHHLAFDVDNLQAEINRLKKEGFKLIHESPKNGADNKLIAFLHPKSTGGLLVELCQDI